MYLARISTFLREAGAFSNRQGTSHVKEQSSPFKTLERTPSYQFIACQDHVLLTNLKFQSFVAVPSITPCTPSNRKMYMCYMMVYKIGILGNLPIAHDSLWVLELMFIEKKSNLRKFYTVHMVSEV
jgi:hypothetical protein